MAPDHDTITEEADAHKDRHIHTELQSALQVDANELDAPQEKDRQARDTGRGREKDTHAEKEGGRERGKEWEREKVRERERERDNATQSVPLLSAGARQATPIAAHKSLSHSHMGEEQQRQIVEVLLLKSARAGHVGVCLYCVLYCGVSLAAVDERGNTALHLAASQVVRRFLYLCVPALGVSVSLWCLCVSMSLCLCVFMSLSKLRCVADTQPRTLLPYGLYVCICVCVAVCVRLEQKKDTVSVAIYSGTHIRMHMHTHVCVCCYMSKTLLFPLLFLFLFFPAFYLSIRACMLMHAFAVMARSVAILLQ